MKATVVTRFKDLILKRIFEVGEKYPAEEVGEERVNLLSKPHPETGKVYIFVEQEEVQSTQETQQDDAQQIDNQDTTPEEPAEEKPKRTRRAPAKKDGE